MPVLTLISEDELITKFDLEGKPIIDISNAYLSFQKIKKNIDNILEF